VGKPDTTSEGSRPTGALIGGFVVVALVAGGLVAALAYPRLQQRRLIAQLEEPGERTFASERILEEGEAIVPALLGALEDPDFTAREDVVELLGRIGDPRARPALLALEDEDLALARLRALGGVRGPEALDEVVEALETGTRREELVALTVLTDWPDDDHERDAELAVALRNYVASDFPGHRALAAEALGRRRHAPATADLIGLLDDEEPAVREQAAWALLQIGSPEAEQAVEAALDAGTVTFSE